MSEEFEKYDTFAKHMEERFPKMFSGKYGGFACGEGWWPILEKLCSNIQHYIDWKKEKFGGLRFYYDGGDEHINGMVRMAEAWADASCEECGAPGKSRASGWIKTLCDIHEAERQQRKKEYENQISQ